MQAPVRLGFPILVMLILSSGSIGARAQTTSSIAPPGSNVSPAWSPSGQRIAFLSMRHGPAELYTMAPDGSDQRRLTVSPADNWRFQWSPDSRLIVFESERSGQSDIYVVSGEAGNETRLTTSGREGSPTWAPDGQRIAFVSGREQGRQVYVMGTNGADQRRITAFRDTPNPVEVAWSPDGRYFALRALDTVQQTTGIFTVISAVQRLYLVQSDGGGVVPLVPTSNNIDAFLWSPDGRRLLVDARLEGSWQIYLFDIASRERRRLTALGANGESAWSRDGRRIAFVSDRDGSDQIHVMDADGIGQTKLTTAGPNYSPAWSPDGQRIAFVSQRDGSFQIYIMNADGTGQIRLTAPP